MKNKKGFTLIELLAVIIILAVIALIATPIVLNVVDNARKSANKDSAYGLLNSAKLYYMESLLDESKSLSGNLIYKINVSGRKPNSGTVYINSKGEIAIAVVYDKVCFTKNYEDADLTESDDIENCIVTVPRELYKDTVLNGADPELKDNLVAVTINTDGTVKKADIYSEWYNYTNKTWANAVLLNGNDTYNVGDTIEENNIKAYYVWIPRYKYQIFYDGTNATSKQLINIVFENKDTTKSTSTTKGEWLTHPAFTFGDDELNGIWVGKFELTGSTTNPTIKPNVTDLKSNVSALFTTTKKLSTNSSMIKNIEWGAIAYLTTSQYGQGLAEVRRNNSNKSITGCAASTVTGTYYNGCQNKYNTQIGVLASTTGNISGIYDMSGGAYEFVMGVMEDSLNSNIPSSGYSLQLNSGFTGKTTGTVANITGVAFPESKYYDIYKYGTVWDDYTRYHLGDATTETKGWNGDYKSFVGSSDPWFVRGGSYSEERGTVGIFSFFGSYGTSGCATRVVLR
mgnify:CR=1 FL=1